MVFQQFTKIQCTENNEEKKQFFENDNFCKTILKILKVQFQEDDNNSPKTIRMIEKETISIESLEKYESNKEHRSSYF